MAHLIVLDGDERMRAALRERLTDEGHLVTTTSDGMLAEAIVATCAHPLVVLVNSDFRVSHGRTRAPELALWRMAVPTTADSASNIFGGTSGGAPRRYIAMTTSDRQPSHALRALLARLSIPILALPCDLLLRTLHNLNDVSELLRLVVEAESDMLAPSAQLALS
jgi:hypothetical protein